MFTIGDLICIALLIYLICLVKKLIGKPSDEKKKDDTPADISKPIPPEILPFVNLNGDDSEEKTEE